MRGQHYPSSATSRLALGHLPGSSSTRRRILKRAHLAAQAQGKGTRQRLPAVLHRFLSDWSRLYFRRVPGCLAVPGKRAATNEQQSCSAVRGAAWRCVGRLQRYAEGEGEVRRGQRQENEGRYSFTGSPPLSADPLYFISGSRRRHRHVSHCPPSSPAAMCGGGA